MGTSFSETGRERGREGREREAAKQRVRGENERRTEK